MIDHVELSVGDLARAVAFYREALAPLGYSLRVDAVPSGLASGRDAPDFWLGPGGPSSPRPHVAFRCATRSEVDRAHRAALAAGGTDSGAPQVLPHIHPDYYAGFVRDPDGHNVELVCHRPA